MNQKKIITGALLAFVIASVGFLAFKELRTGAPGGVSDAVAMEKNAGAALAPGKAPQQQKGRQVIAYYFHTTFRCATCYKIEQLTSESIKKGFPDELKNGSLQWKPVNVEEAGNDHFARDYRLLTKSVVLVDMQDGVQVRWKNLKDIWKLVNSKEDFTKYIQDETRSYLKKG